MENTPRTSMETTRQSKSKFHQQTTKH